MLNVDDSDKMIAAYGYGARLPPDHKKTSHCFPLSFNESNPEVPGLPGLMNAYQNAINQVKLYGPTNMAPLLRTAQAIASHRQHEYLICLIITDGVISDQATTIGEIVKASQLPLSIVIIGVG